MNNGQGVIFVYDSKEKVALEKHVDIIELKEEFIGVFANGLESAQVITEKQGYLKEGTIVEAVE